MAGLTQPAVLAVVFVSAVLLDVLYARYIRAVAQQQRWRAVWCSVALGGCNLVGISQVMRGGAGEAVAFLSGLAVGTWLGMRK